MFGRIFGRDKDNHDQAVCAECGRTLLAGEWTQTVVGPDGQEQIICSLCGQSRDLGNEAPAAVPTPANNGRVRETRTEAPRDARGESDAFWKALKDKDAEIERLHEQLARSEAEKQELAGRLARMDASDEGAAAYAPGVDSMAAPALPAAPLIPASGPVVNELTGDSSEPGERTWGETPAEFAAELAALREETAPAEAAADEASAAGSADESIAAAPADEAVAAGSDEALDDAPAQRVATQAAPELAGQTPPAVVFEDTQEISAEEAAIAAAQPGILGDPETTLAPAAGSPAAREEAPAGPSADEIEAQAASLTLLQRGVDLLNVSRVPRKIAETNEQLGLPSVHVGFDGQTVAVTFMWTMGWYRFHVDIDSGDVGMDERGYDELAHLQPNAAVRADGTVQLAPAQISRAAAQRPPEREREPAPEAPAEERAPAEPETPRVAAQKPPEILSKSLLGQRSDDEAASWEQTQARDFDWDR
ncbi:MAG TPA: hypothetical protein VFD50_10395 [Thermoleophilia bacterium]|nr:hypothetical protein [Thermoleophilia bacterium]